VAKGECPLIYVETAVRTFTTQKAQEQIMEMQQRKKWHDLPEVYVQLHKDELGDVGRCSWPTGYSDCDVA
jgi:hypothetical protein